MPRIDYTERILILWAKGLSVAQIAERLGVVGSTIRHYLNRNGIASTSRQDPVGVVIPGFSGKSHGFMKSVQYRR